MRSGRVQGAEVKEKADVVIGSNDEEGIADYIEINILKETWIVRRSRKCQKTIFPGIFVDS